MVFFTSDWTPDLEAAGVFHKELSTLNELWGSGMQRIDFEDAVDTAGYVTVFDGLAAKASLQPKGYDVLTN